MTKHSVRNACQLAVSIANDREHETHGALSGEPHGGPFCSVGILPRPFVPLLAHADYVVRSYLTPIAFRVARSVLDELDVTREVKRVQSSAFTDRECMTGGDYYAVGIDGDDDRVWIVPTRTYSVSTGRHQSTMRDALTHYLPGKIVRRTSEV